VFASTVNQLADLNTDVAGKKEPSDSSSYYSRNVAYYAHKLNEFDNVISVVPLQQRDVLKHAALRASELCGSVSSDRLRLVFYGDVLVEQGARDSITSGVFSSVDGFVGTHAAALGVPAGVIAGSLTFLMLRTRSVIPVRLDLPAQVLHRDFLRIVGVLEAMVDAESDIARSWSDTPIGTDLELALVKHLLFYPLLLDRVRRDLGLHALASFAVTVAGLMWRYGQFSKARGAAPAPCRPLLQAGDVVLRSALAALGISV